MADPFVFQAPPVPSWASLSCAEPSGDSTSPAPGLAQRADLRHPAGALARGSPTTSPEADRGPVNAGSQAQPCDLLLGSQVPHRASWGRHHWDLEAAPSEGFWACLSMVLPWEVARAAKEQAETFTALSLPPPIFSLNSDFPTAEN